MRITSTILRQIPSGSFDRNAYELLLEMNWSRIAAYSAYGLLGLLMVWQTVSPRTKAEEGLPVGPSRPMCPTHCGGD